MCAKVCCGLFWLTLANSMYSALWCVFKCLIKLFVLDDVLYLPLPDTLADQSLQSAVLLSSSFILKYVKHLTSSARICHASVLCIYPSEVFLLTNLSHDDNHDWTAQKNAVALSFNIM